MGHHNTQFNLGTDPQGYINNHPHPEPCIFYGNFPHPNIVPALGNGGTLFYTTPHYNTVHPQHPSTNLDLAVGVGAPSTYYNPYLNHEAHDQRLVGAPTPGSFKRKNADGGHDNYYPYYHNGSAGAGPSSSIGLDITAMDASFHDPSPMVENRPHRSVSRPIQANYVSAPVQLPGNHPLLDMRFGANNGDMVGPFAWPNIPYAPHLPPPMQGVRGYNGNFPSQLAASNLSLVPPTGFRFYQPTHGREIVRDSSTRYRHFPHLRVLPEDEVALLEIPGYHEAGNSIDQHLDMRLDIDHMSYEELLALGEHIGSVGTGLNEEFIQNNLKTRNFTSFSSCINLEEPADCMGQQINFCVICQTDYSNGENIGTLDCGHEYHTECIKKWLLMNNNCPVCKFAGLSGKGRDL